MKRLLPLILFLALVLRTIGLESYPPGFTPDEASFGYDAYSILKTGKDQWGKSFPLVLESFGDFKSPLYAYLTIPSVSIFGLNKFAVRLPNALLGTLAVLITYLLATKLFNRRVGLFSAFLLAISPWHVMLSRGAFEANLTTFFLPLGLYLLIEKKYALSVLALGLNLFSYHSAKVVTPFVLLAFLFFFKEELLRKKRELGVFLLVFTFFLVANLYTLRLGAGTRAVERSITQGAVGAASEDRAALAGLVGDPVARLVHNKYTVSTKRFLENYVTYFSPQFFFTTGPKEGTYGMIPGRGVLYWFVIPFFLGARKLLYGGKHKKEILFLSLWVLFSAVPASLATGVGYSANRVSGMMPGIDILLGLGGVVVFDFLKKRKKLLYTFLFLVAVLFVSFLEDYFVQSPRKIAKDMLYGNLEVADWVSRNVEKEASLIVDKSLSEPHIYFAFSERLEPIFYQKETGSWSYETWVDQMPEYRLERYLFKDINASDLEKDAILIGRPQDFNFEVKPREIIYYPDGKEAIYVVDARSSLYAKTN
ncbi:MAG: ArnT family glycosyltransferase [Patescibacteria group bacterium]